MPTGVYKRIFKSKFCLNCDKEYIPTKISQKYCGSYIKETGCSYIMQKKSSAYIKNKSYNKLKKDKNYYPKIRDKRYFDKYNITLDDYESMLIKQNNLCAICNQEETFRNRRLTVDHCHKTGKVRGLLCNKCNLAIGHLGDSSKLLEEALKYIKRNE